MIKKEVTKKIEKAITYIGFMLIGSAIALLLCFCIDVGLVKVNTPKYKEEYNTMINDLKYEVDNLTHQKESLLKEINDLTYSKNELEKEYKELSQSNIIEKWVPENAGKTKTYMCYSQNWVNTSQQYKLHNDVSSEIWYDENGYARLGDRFFVAVKPYYGDVGDYIDVYQEDGSVIQCIIGDIKGFENNDLYIHHDGSIVEFMVKNLSFPGVRQTRTDFWQTISVIKNIGNYYDNK